MRYALWDHAGKAAYLQQRLRERGHEPAVSLEECDVFLVDHDGYWAHPRPELIANAYQAGIKVVMYPHGGLPGVFVYDGLTPPDDRVCMRLEHGPGALDVAEILGLDLNVLATGWLFSPTLEFAPTRPVKVLFAPQHPNMATINTGNGHDPAPRRNQELYRQLLGLGFEVTVSMVGPGWRNGVWPHPRARFLENPQMLFQNSYMLVMEADLVVGAGTVAATGVACGKPTVMFGQGDYSDWIDGVYKQPNDPGLYDELVRYPLDAEDADLADLIEAACAGSDAAAGWRARWIGDDGSLLAVRALEHLVGEQENREATSRRVVVGGATARAKGT